MLPVLVLSVGCDPAHICSGNLDLGSSPAAFSSRPPSCCPEGKMLLLLEAELTCSPPQPPFSRSIGTGTEIFPLLLLRPWQFSHLHVSLGLKPYELKLKKLGRGKKKLIQESSAWINGAKEQAEVAQLGVRRSLLMCCVRSSYRRLSSEVHKAKAFPV